MRVQCPYCSGEFNTRQRKRSVPQHRRFFGMVAAAKIHWPERHEFQPTDPEHLRKWLTAKAGFVDRHVIDPPPDLIASDPRAARLARVWMEQAITLVTRGHDHVWIRSHGDAIVVFIPKSISFHEMGPQEFGLLNDAVSDVIEREIGISGDELLRRHKCAA